METKFCNRCKKHLSTDAFRLRHKYEKTFLAPNCRPCEAAYEAERYQAKKEGRLVYIPDPLNIAAHELWGHITRTGQLRPIVKVELEAA